MRSFTSILEFKIFGEPGAEYSQNVINLSDRRNKLMFERRPPPRDSYLQKAKQKLKFVVRSQLEKVTLLWKPHSNGSSGQIVPPHLEFRVLPSIKSVKSIQNVMATQTSRT